MTRSTGPRGGDAVRWRSAVVAGLVLLWAGIAWSQGAQRIGVQVLVCQTSALPGGVDPACSRLDAKLAREFRYESLKRLQSHGLSLAVDEVGSVALPNGKQLRLRPLQFDAHSALLAVDVEGSVQTDLRVRNGHLVVIGAERHGDGKLVIGLEPRW